MGSHKLLLPLEGESLVRRAVRRVLEAPFAQVVVVVGRESARVGAELAGLPVSLVENPRYAEGLASSFRAGAAAVPPGVEAAVFTFADRPFVTAELYRRVLAAYALGRPLLVAGRYGDVLAPPHLLRRELFARVASEGVGIRPLLEAHLAQSVVLDFPPDALIDVDDPADYERVLALAAQGAPR
jgi:molybdenum cofactor cytidylyltransferase